MTSILCLRILLQPGVVVHSFKPSTQEAEARQTLCVFQASLVYGVSSRIARTTQRPCLEDNKTE